MRARLAAVGLLVTLPAHLHGLNSGPALHHHRTKPSSSRARLYAKHPSAKQGANDPSDQNSDGDVTTSPKLPWKTLFTFAGGMVGGVVVSAGLAFGALTTHVEDPDGLYESTALFSNILSELNKDYVDEVDPRKLVATAADAMLKSLDPYSEFEATQEQAEQMQEVVQGRYGGVGLVISAPPKPPQPPAKAPTPSPSTTSLPPPKPGSSDKEGDTTAPVGPISEAAQSKDALPSVPPSSSFILDALPGRKKALQQEKDKERPSGVLVVNAFEGYAFDQGMRVGDRLISVDGVDVRSLSADQARNLLRGSPSSTVKVRFERDALRPIADPNPEDLSMLTEVDGDNDGTDMAKKSMKGPRTFEVNLPRTVVHIPDVKVATLLDAKHQPIDQSKLSDALRRQRLQMEMEAKSKELESASISSDGTSTAAGGGGGLLGFNQLSSFNIKEEDPWKGYVPPEGPLVGYVQLSGFTQGAGQEVGLAYQSLQLQSLLLQGPEALNKLVQQQQLAAADAAATTAETATDIEATTATTTETPTAASESASTNPKENSKGKSASKAEGSGRRSSRSGSGSTGSSGSGSKSADTSSEGAAAADETQRAGLRARALSYVADPYFGGVILDLRGNPGGLLTSAVEVASLLVPENSDLVSAQGRGFPAVKYLSDSGAPLRDVDAVPLVVLVNEDTASAAEIVSGAVQDLDAGIILGSGRTFGKGLVQTIEQTPLSTALKFTVAKYYTPSGRCIQSTDYGDSGSARKTKNKDGPKANSPLLNQEPISGNLPAGTEPGTGAEAGAGVEGEQGEEDTTDADAEDVEDNGIKSSSKTYSSKAVKKRNTFKTAHGRLVRDGGGVDVDVKVEGAKLPAVEALLITQDAFFGFATRWTREHPYAGRPAVDDRTYGLFAADVKQQLATDAIMPETIYAPELPALEKTLRKSLSRLEEFSSSSSSDTSAGKSAKVPEIPAIVELRQALKKQVEKDFASETPTLRAALEEAILARYLPESQLREMALMRDTQVAAAVDLALDRPRYDALLRPPAAAQEAEGQVRTPTTTTPSLSKQ